MGLSYLSITILFILQINYCQCKGDKSKSKDATSVRKDVIVVGGGIAGMAAARRLVQEGNFNVKVFEARKDRYGGRIWTNRNAAKGVKGVDVEMGAMFLNTKGKSESLHKLVKEFELRTEHSGTVNVYFPEKDAETKVYGAEATTQLYTEAIKILVKAVNKVKKSNIDRPLLDVIHEELDKTYAETESPKFSKDAVTKIINTLPTPLCQNFSALSYEIEHEFGWDSIIVDGMDAFVDRLVAGSGMEVPLKIELNKIVVNIEIDEKRNKVKVRTNDRQQAVVDAVVVAVPAGVLKNRLIVFEPKLSREWENAMTNLGVGYSSKVVVGFSEAFWPRDVGSFTVSSQTASDGFLQMWTNAYRLSGNPYLVGNIFGEKAKHWESVPIKDLKERVKIILGQMFGSENVNAHNMTTFVHSEWSTDPLVMGSVSYPRVGNKPDLWDTLKKPVCPYIYFAGAYTESSGHVDSVHGAYNSGLRAAKQIISNICKTKKSSSETKSKSNKADKDIKKKKKLKEMKDEL